MSMQVYNYIFSILKVSATFINNYNSYSESTGACRSFCVKHVSNLRSINYREREKNLNFAHWSFAKLTCI